MSRSPHRVVCRFLALSLLAFGGAGCVGLPSCEIDSLRPTCDQEPKQACFAWRERAAAALAAGDLPCALHRYRTAILLARDPVVRAAIAGEHRAAARVVKRPDAARAWARSKLDQGETDGVDELLREARRRARRPAVDYSLLSRLSYLRGGEDGAHAYALLAREHAQDGRCLEDFVAALWRVTPKSTVVASR